MEPHWTSYVGMITGVFGAMASVGAGILAYTSYRKVNSIKTQVLRLELHCARNNAEQAHTRLAEILEDARASRQAIASATGKVKSGWMIKFQQQYDADRYRIKNLATEIPGRDADYDSLTSKQIETELVGLHRIQGEIKHIIDGYKTEIAADDKERENLKLSVRKRIR